MSLFSKLVGAKKDEETKQFWKAKIRPFLMDDTVKWEHVGFFEKFRIKNLQNKRK